MARYLRTVVHQDVAVAAAATPIEKNLGVNPLSFLLMTIRAQTLAALTLPTLANLLGVFSSVDVRFKGTSIISLSPADLYRMAAALWGRFAHRENLDDDLNGVTWITVPVPFGRIPYWSQEAFPASRSGDLVLSLTPAASFANVATVTIQVEQVELLDAVPTQFLKYTTFPKTPTAVGEHDMDLPLGNPILGALLFGTTVPTGTSFNASIAAVKMLVDNVENYYSFANWESIHGDFQIRAHPEWEMETFRVLENLAAAYTQNVESGLPSDLHRTHRQYAYLDFDPLRNGMYQLETEGRGRVHLRITADVADPIRMMPIELIKLPGAEGAPTS